jgi:hypothetical protein
MTIQNQDEGNVTDEEITVEDILQMLEEEALELEDGDNPYKPLNFHDTTESY